MNSCWIKCIGTWLFADALYSLFIYLRRSDQCWWADHSVRVLRAILGILLIVWG